MEGMEHYKKREYLSISSLCSFARCPRKFFYSSGCRIVPIEEHPALHFGESIHYAVPEVLDKGLDAGISAFDKIWEPEKGDKKRDRTTALAILRAFNENHKGNRSLYKLIAPPENSLEIEDRVSSWEVPFAIDIGLDVPLVGRIDALAQHRDTGNYWCIDFKTASYFSDNFWRSFTIDPQCIGYTLAAKTMCDYDFDGTMIEGLLVNKTKADTQVWPVNVYEHHLTDFIHWARYIGAQILACEEQQEFPKDISACSSRPQFGVSTFQCDYLDLCQAPKWTDMKDFYRQNEHKPFILSKPTVEGKPVR